MTRKLFCSELSLLSSFPRIGNNQWPEISTSTAALLHDVESESEESDGDYDPSLELQPINLDQRDLFLCTKVHGTLYSCI